jgi:hypothetical protein
MSQTLFTIFASRDAGSTARRQTARTMQNRPHNAKSPLRHMMPFALCSTPMKHRIAAFRRQTSPHSTCKIYFTNVLRFHLRTADRDSAPPPIPCPKIPENPANYSIMLEKQRRWLCEPGSVCRAASPVRSRHIFCLILDYRLFCQSDIADSGGNFDERSIDETSTRML